MSKSCFYIILVLFLSSCQAKDEDTAFRAFLENFQQRSSVLWHGLAPKSGSNQISPILKIPEAEIFTSNLVFCKNQLIAIQKIDPGQLSKPFRKEYDQTLAYLERTIYLLEVEKIHEKHAGFYDVTPFFERIISSGKLEDLHDNLGLLPAYYEAVKYNLSHRPDDLEKAIEREKAFYQLLLTKVPKAIQISENIEDTKATNLLLSAAKIAVKDYIAFLNSLQFEVENKALDALQRHPVSKSVSKSQKND